MLLSPAFLGAFIVWTRRKRIKMSPCSLQCGLVKTKRKASVRKNFLLRFLRNENGDFSKHITCSMVHEAKLSYEQ